MRNFLIVSVLFFISSAGMTALFASMAGEQGMKNYFVNVVQERMNCVDADWYEEKIDAKSRTELRLNSLSTDVKIESSETDELIVEYVAQKSPDAGKRSIYKIDGKAIILDLEGFSGDDQHLQLSFQQGEAFNLKVDNAPLRLKVPQNIKIVYADSISGDMKFEGLNLHIVEIVSVSGDIRFLKSDIGDLQLKTTSGDLNFNGHLKNIDAYTVSGDLKFELMNTNTAAVIESTSGDVKVKLKENKNFNIRFDSTSGEARFENEKNSSSGFVNIPAEGPLWKVRTVSGDFKISENENFEDSEKDHSSHQQDLSAKSNAQLKKCSHFRVFGFKID